MKRRKVGKTPTYRRRPPNCHQPRRKKLAKYCGFTCRHHSHLGGRFCPPGQSLGAQGGKRRRHGGVLVCAGKCSAMPNICKPRPSGPERSEPVRSSDGFLSDLCKGGPVPAPEPSCGHPVGSGITLSEFSNRNGWNRDRAGDVPLNLVISEISLVHAVELPCGGSSHSANASMMNRSVGCSLASLTARAR